MGLIFQVNGDDVSKAALGRVGPFSGTNPLLADVYAAFTDLGATVPIKKLTMTGNAVALVATVEREDGWFWNQTIALGAPGSDPIVTIDLAGWHWREVVATRRLADAIIALAKSAVIGTLKLENA